ncbi:MAG: glycosyltransferase family 9 protein [Ignavibacteriaceae bacterium]|nr:glycosyltransferase family 9 protein [Ignavibacteriaceae bacterium]
MKILVNALSGIGDALMFTPSLHLLKKSYPDSEIHALVMFKAVKDFYERNENISKVFYFDFMSEGFLKSLKYIFSLRNSYDISISVYPSNRKEYNVINFLQGSKLKAAVKYLRKDFQNFGWLNNVRIIENDSLHNVQTNLKLCEKLTAQKLVEEPRLDLPLIQSDLDFANAFLKEKKINTDDLVVGFHPGSATLKNQANRRWEPEKFALLGKKLIEAHNAKILIFGGPTEEELKQNIVGQINNPNAFSVVSHNLTESAAVMKQCNVFVTNDSSLMHVASALQLNVVAIIGPTNPNYIHPWKTKHKIVSLNLDCSPCFIYSPRPLICNRTDVKFKCIKELDVERVYSAAMELVNSN